MFFIEVNDVHEYTWENNSNNHQSKICYTKREREREKKKENTGQKEKKLKWNSVLLADKTFRLKHKQKTNKINN